MAGVANTGTAENWSGSIFNQANWYAFGRLAWDPELSARDIAEEWTRQTFSNNATTVRPIVAMIMGSRQTVVDYMMPLGLNMIFGNGTHYGPGPWDEISSRPDWRAPYYHKADARATETKQCYPLRRSMLVGSPGRKSPKRRCPS